MTDKVDSLKEPAEVPEKARKKTLKETLFSRFWGEKSSSDLRETERRAEEQRALGKVFAPLSHPPSPPPETEQEENSLSALTELESPLSSSSLPTPSESWLGRLSQGLSRSSSALSQNFINFFRHKKLNAQTLEEMEDILIQADFPMSLVERLAEVLRKGRYEKNLEVAEVQTILAQEIENILISVAQPLILPPPGPDPFVILVVGVNGAGKTTTIGKLAAKWAEQKREILLIAGDTFRAAAIDQLQIWADRAKVDIITNAPGSDSAAIAFEGLTQGIKAKKDLILMDTAGRLHNRKELIDELKKIIRTMKKINSAFPHLILVTLDATTGQNALNQVEIFGNLSEHTALVMTKLDGTARGGILVAIADKFKLPIHFIGVGEDIQALESFNARDFARALTGLS